MKIRIHSIEHTSKANGPGLRAVIWVQGCTLNCPGCFNPNTHDPHGGLEIETKELVQRLLSISNSIDGVSISGGEPLQQPGALLDFLRRITTTQWSVLLFSGYTLQEIKQQPLGNEILALTDVLIAGRYQKPNPSGGALIGSCNQKIHLLTSRYRFSDFGTIPRCEAILHKDGTVTLTGFHPWKANS